jgi:UTP--glucose-1-phosphate uridylyltransferase
VTGDRHPVTGGPVRTAVIPAAGLGTRFLPATKAVPKEMLPVVDRPMIEYAVAEAAAAGIEDVVIVTGEGKEAIERHFAPDPALEAALERAGKVDLLRQVRASCELASCRYVTQDQPLGLGHAVGTARKLVDEPFAVLLPDELILGDLLGRMIAVFDREQSAVLGLMEVPPADVAAYGCPDPEPISAGLVRVRSTVEKPSPETAPSNLAIIGRYVFTPALFDALDRTDPGVGGEIQLTDAIDLLAREGNVFGVLLEEGRFDVGRKIDFLRASIELALAREDMGPELEETLREIVGHRGPGR